MGGGGGEKTKKTTKKPKKNPRENKNVFDSRRINNCIFDYDLFFFFLVTDLFPRRNKFRTEKSFPVVEHVPNPSVSVDRFEIVPKIAYDPPPLSSFTVSRRLRKRLGFSRLTATPPLSPHPLGRVVYEIFLRAGRVRGGGRTHRCWTVKKKKKIQKPPPQKKKNP